MFSPPRHIITPASMPKEDIVVLLTRVGVGDLIGLVGIQPDLLLAAAQDAGGQPLLEPEHAAGHTHTQPGLNTEQRRSSSAST